MQIKNSYIPWETAGSQRFPRPIEVDNELQEVLRKLSAVQTTQAAPQRVLVEKNLAETATAELIMELLKRGFAVLKCPEPGVAPDTLKAADA